MRYILLLLLEALVLINVTGCKKHDDCAAVLVDGQYSGSFKSTSSGQAGGKVSHITLNLNNGKYTGTTDVSYYPAFCNAGYSRNKNTVTFEDNCIWPMIAGLVQIGGTYTVSKTGDSVVLTATNYDIATRVLTLKRIN